MLRLPPGYGMIEGEFAKHLLGVSLTIIQAKDVKPGDRLIDFQCTNFAHQIPALITKVTPSGEFFHINWEGRDGSEGRQYAHSCLFGRLNQSEGD